MIHAPGVVVARMRWFQSAWEQSLKSPFAEAAGDRISMKSVGLIIGIEYEGQDALILQIRSGGQSWSGACQVTVEGKLEPAEDSMSGVLGFEQALWREISEELGSGMASWLRAYGQPFIPLGEYSHAEKRLIKFGIKLPLSYSEFIDLVIPGAECAGFRLFTREDKARELRPEEQHYGVPPGETAMFSDSLQTVRAAFLKLPCSAEAAANSVC